MKTFVLTCVCSDRIPDERMLKVLRFSMQVVSDLSYTLAKHPVPNTELPFAYQIHKTPSKQTKDSE